MMGVRAAAPRRRPALIPSIPLLDARALFCTKQRALRLIGAPPMRPPGASGLGCKVELAADFLEELKVKARLKAAQSPATKVREMVDRAIAEDGGC